MKTDCEMLLRLLQAEDNDAKRVHMMNNYKIKRDQFETIFDPRRSDFDAVPRVDKAPHALPNCRHEALRARGERRFTHKALLGIIMIMLYKEEPRWGGENEQIERRLNFFLKGFTSRHS